MLFAICNKNEGADTPVRPPTLHRTPCKNPCHCEGAKRPRQSASPVPGPPCLRGLSRQSRAWGILFSHPGHAGPALQSVALPGLGGQGRPPLRSSIGKRCVGADAYIGPPYRTPHRKKAAGFSPRRTTILMHCHFSSAAATNPQNGGCGLSGLLRNSGWN